MQLQGPSAVTFVAPAAQVACSISFDLVGHQYTIVYTNGAGATKTITGPIPAALQTSLENHIKAQIEANEGWANGSSSIVTP